MNHFISAEVVFSAQLPPSDLPVFKKRKWGREPDVSPPNSVFWNLGEAGGGPSFIGNIINFDFRISGFMSLLNLTL